MQYVLKVVAENDKKRFEIWEGSGEHYIRATQGHSIKWVDDEELHTKLTLEDTDLPTACVHGTYRKLWPNIIDKGLLIGAAAATTGITSISRPMNQGTVASSQACATTAKWPFGWTSRRPCAMESPYARAGTRFC